MNTNNIANGYILCKNINMASYLLFMSTKTKSTALGQNIKLFRKQKGWTQVELAQKLGCSQAMITAYENAQKRPDLDKINRLAQLFGISTDQLLGNEKPPKEVKPKNIRLWKRFEKVEQLPKEDQKALTKMIDAMIQTRGGNGRKK